MGSIPAHAGEPSTTPRLRSAIRVDPRARGGARRRTSSAMSRRGRSPRTRGSPEPGRAALVHRGSIPAHAGEPSCPAALPARLEVDPRARGGAGQGQREGVQDGGRSPRTRGSHGARSVQQAEGRSIPAHAGEPSPGTSARSCPGVDPRARGGARGRGARRQRDGGRSPRTRGSLGNRNHAVIWRRSIPAHAGEPL